MSENCKVSCRRLLQLLSVLLTSVPWKLGDLQYIQLSRSRAGHLLWVGFVQNSEFANSSKNCRSNCMSVKDVTGESKGFLSPGESFRLHVRAVLGSSKCVQLQDSMIQKREEVRKEMEEGGRRERGKESEKVVRKQERREEGGEGEKRRRSESPSE